jgi:phosphate-selective porin OprO/OprP
MPDFGDGKTQLVDAYVEWVLNDSAQIRIGKFKPSFGLERLQSAVALRLCERGYPSSIGPNRDVGLQLSGALIPEVQYALGVFNGVADGGSGDSDGDDGKDVVGRVWLMPFQSMEQTCIEKLGFGVSGSFGDGGDAAPGSYKSIGQTTVFSYLSGVSEGQRTRFSPQMYWYWGPFGMLGEYAYVRRDLKKGGASKQIKNEAWQLTASWVLSGEENGYKALKPRHAFDPSNGSWGAVELVGRMTALDLDNDVFSGFANSASSVSSAESLGAGINWYLTDNIKAGIEYERTAFKGGAASGDREDEQLVMFRWQAAF